MRRLRQNNSPKPPHPPSPISLHLHASRLPKSPLASSSAAGEWASFTPAGAVPLPFPRGVTSQSWPAVYLNVGQDDQIVSACISPSPTRH